MGHRHDQRGGRRGRRIGWRWGRIALALLASMMAGCAAGGGGRVLHVGEATARLGPLAGGARERFVFTLERPATLDLRVRLAEAPFNGTQLHASLNGRRLLPYVAFGGDTRYESVRGQPGMRPPIPTIEGRWLLTPPLLRDGRNTLELWTTGVTPSDVLDKLGPPPRIVVDGLSLRRADGGELPVFANTVEYMFSTWALGYDWGRGGERRARYDHALLGIVNGNGLALLIAGLGGERSLWEAKRQAERSYLDWGYGDQEFYTIWELYGRPEAWATFINVDGRDDPPPQFHNQTLYPPRLAEYEPAQGADIVLYDVARWSATLEPAIAALAPYASVYNFKCEQRGAWGQGFGADGQRWAAQGYDGDTWASNFYEASKAARDLVLKYDPQDGRVHEQNHWTPDIRTLLFDTARRRGQPMGDMVDMLATHYGTLAEYDLDDRGRAIPGDTMSLQYPGDNDFTGGRPSRWIYHVSDEGMRWVRDSGYPEIAIDFNRYRLGRSETDLLPGIDAAKHRWGNGQPFDYRAGLRGDELSLNSENSLWHNYSPTAPYQFLHGFFAYSLLPTGAAEPRDLRFTRRESLTQHIDVRVNLYGRWIDGVAGTKRLRTVDPLYGDMFGWTGNEHAHAGDYKQRSHRRPGHDACGLLRRMGYAFLVSGPVLPATQGPEHDEALFVKALVQVFEGRRYACVYAANFTDRTQTLDVALPLRLARPAEALVFDEEAWDWAVHEKRAVPAGQRQRFTAKVAPLGAWMAAIPLEDDALAAALGLPPPPRPAAPELDAPVTGVPEFTFTFPASAAAAAQRQQVEVATEARFRAQDRLELSAPADTRGRYRMAAAPQPGQRLWWRVRSVAADGQAGPWSDPQPFVYDWPEYSAAFPQRPRPPRGQPPPVWDWLTPTHPAERPSLVWDGELWATDPETLTAGRAADAQIESVWTGQARPDRGQPAQWAVTWPAPQAIRTIAIHWHEGAMPAAFVVEVSADAQHWTPILEEDRPEEATTQMRLDPPRPARYLRITVPEARAPDGNVSIREVLVD